MASRVCRRAGRHDHPATPHPDSAGVRFRPALVAVTTTAAGAVRAATAPTMPDEAAQNVSVAASPGPVVGSACTGYLGLDLGVLAARQGTHRLVRRPDPHIAQILATGLSGVPSLGDAHAIDSAAVEPVDVLTSGFPWQETSIAGRRSAIENGARSGLWTDIVAGVRLLRPALLSIHHVKYERGVSVSVRGRKPVVGVAVTTEPDCIELVEVLTRGGSELPKRLGDRATDGREWFVLCQMQRSKDHVPVVPYLRDLCAVSAEELGLDIGRGTLRRTRCQRIAEASRSFPESVEFWSPRDGHRVDERVGHGQQRQVLAKGHDSRLLNGASQVAKHGFAGDDRLQAISHVHIVVWPATRARHWVPGSTCGAPAPGSLSPVGSGYSSACGRSVTPAETSRSARHSSPTPREVSVRSPVSAHPPIVSTEDLVAANHRTRLVTAVAEWTERRAA